MSKLSKEEIMELLDPDTPWEDHLDGESFFDDRGVPIDTPELRMWRGKIGMHYFFDNHPRVEERRGVLNSLLSGVEFSSVLEIGCNVGNNLAMLWNGKRKLYGMEPMFGLLRMSNFFGKAAGTAFAIPFVGEAFDLILIAGVLCHIRSEFLDFAVSEAVRVCRKNILVLDYYSEREESLPFRGTNSLWTRDFLHPFREKTKVISSGPLTGWDIKNMMHYGLLEKER